MFPSPIKSTSIATAGGDPSVMKINIDTVDDLQYILLCLVPSYAWILDHYGLCITCIAWVINGYACLDA